MNRYFWAFLAFDVGLYLLVFRSLFFVNAFSMLDSEPSPMYYRQYLFALNSPSTFLYNFMNSISWNSPERVFTILPFILGTLLFYFFAKSLKVSEWKAWLFSFLYMLNPATATIFYVGDAPGILMMYSIFPLVMMLGFRLLNSTTLYNAFLLAGSLILANFFFYQAFLLIWPFFLVLILLSKNKLKLFAFLLLADVLAFLSDVNFEIMIYLTVVPSLSLQPIEPVRYFLKEVYYAAFYLGIYGIVLFLYRAKKEARAFLAIALILLFSWSLLFEPLPRIPLLDAIFLAFTTFFQKMLLLINGLVIMSFLFLNRKWETVLALVIAVLLSLSNFQEFSIVTQKYTSAYAILTFDAKKYQTSDSFFELEKFFYENPGFYYVGIPSYQLYSANHTFVYEIYDLIPYSIEVSTTNGYSLAKQGVKYVVSLYPLSSPGLRSVYNVSPFYVYEVENFSSVAFSPSGKPLNVTVTPNKVVVYGNTSEAIVLIPYSKFWTNSENYSGYLKIPVSNGIRISYNLAYYLNQTLLVIDFLVIFLVVFVIVEGHKLLRRVRSDGK